MTTLLQGTPPLAQGDVMSREEFLRRWDAQPEIKFAELIGGIVYMPSPVSVEHGEMEGNIAIWAGTYSTQTPGVRLACNTTTLMLGNALQPDVNLRVATEYGGRTRLDGSNLSGAPEFIVEVSRSSSSYDLHQKLEVYQEAGVDEYLTVLLFEQEIRWHRLAGATYEVLPAVADGIWRSRVFPGLWLDGKALLGDDMTRVLAALHQGLQSEEHARFVRDLKERKK